MGNQKCCRVSFARENFGPLRVLGFFSIRESCYFLFSATVLEIPAVRRAVSTRSLCILSFCRRNISISYGRGQLRVGRIVSHLRVGPIVVTSSRPRRAGGAGFRLRCRVSKRGVVMSRSRSGLARSEEETARTFWRARDPWFSTTTPARRL